MTGFGFDGFQVIFMILFVIVLGVFVAVAVKGLVTWNKNNKSPRLTVDAVVVSKREDVSCHRSGMAGDMTGAHGYHTTVNTSYYVTFQFESGDRLELNVHGEDYGMLAQNDRGKLTFQGTRYLGFDRT